MRRPYYFVGPVALTSGPQPAGYAMTRHRLSRTDGGPPCAWHVDLWGPSLCPGSPLRWVKGWTGSLAYCVAQAISYTICLAEGPAVRYDGEDGAATSA